ncbi:hypothetical protein BDR05DRAFT_1000908 [Suillus weaverae]|nr:hypothetical protein BDR05DRAFT_1000908 [Suillus weaverae]
MACARMRNDINSDKFFALNNLGSSKSWPSLLHATHCDVRPASIASHSSPLSVWLPLLLIHLLSYTHSHMEVLQGLLKWANNLLLLEQVRSWCVCSVAPRQNQCVCTLVFTSCECPLVSKRTYGSRWALDTDHMAVSDDPDVKSVRSGSRSGVVAPFLSRRAAFTTTISGELCHPSLAPVTGKKSRAAVPFVDATWRYNVIEHINEAHPQYAYHKNPQGHPLPLDILNSFTLTSLEQHDAGIPESLWLLFSKATRKIDPIPASASPSTPTI